MRCTKTKQMKNEMAQQEFIDNWQIIFEKLLIELRIWEIQSNKDSVSLTNLTV